MNRTASKQTLISAIRSGSFIDAMRQRLAEAAELRASNRANHAVLKQYHVVGTIRAPIHEENLLTGRRGIAQGVAQLLENGYGLRKVTGNCDAIEECIVADAFRDGKSLAEIAHMTGVTMKAKN